MSITQHMITQAACTPVLICNSERKPRRVVLQAGQARRFLCLKIAKIYVMEKKTTAPTVAEQKQESCYQNLPMYLNLNFLEQPGRFSVLLIESGYNLQY